MYLEHFGLKQAPFQLTPDSEYLYLSHSHARAMAYMDYSTWNQEGFVVITGPVGVGKTILVKKFLSELPSNVLVAKIFQTQLDEVEFLQAMLVEYGLNPFNARKVELMDMLNTFLIQAYMQNRQALLLVDDAQNLSPRVLEEIRMLSSLETNKEKMLRVILVGQPELNKTIELPEMEQLLQRIRLRFHINLLNPTETKAYILHRLGIAGAGKRKIFTDDSYEHIYKYSGGVPRLINSICDTALTCAFADEKAEVNLQTVKDAVAELQWPEYAEREKELQKPKESSSSSSLAALDENPEIVRLLKSIDSHLSDIKSYMERVGQVQAGLSALESQVNQIKTGTKK